MSVGPSWQWPQCPTPQRMFRSSETWIRSGATPRARSACDREAHHHLRPADERDRRGGIEARAGISFGTTPTFPPTRRPARRPSRTSAPPHPPARRDTAGRRASAPRRAPPSCPYAGSPRERVQDDRPEWREADPAGDDDHVGPRRVVDRPRRAERPTQAEHGSRPRSRRSLPSPRPRLAPSARSGLAVAAADRDRHLADAEDVDHHELARLDRRCIARRRARGSASRCRRSRASARARRTSAGPSARAGRSSGAAVAIDVQQPQPRPLQSLDEHLRESFHQLVAERRILVALAAQARSVEGRRADRRTERARRSASGTAGTATTSRSPRPPRSSRSSRRRAQARASRSPRSRRGRRRTRPPARPRGRARRPREVHVRRAARDQLQLLGAHACEERQLRDHVVNSPDHRPPSR